MPAPTFRVFDAHVNIGRGELDADPIKSNITARQILDLMKESGVEKSLIFPVSRIGGYAEGNMEVGNLVKQHPNCFLGFGRIRSNPRRRSRHSSRVLLSNQTSVEKLSNKFSILRRKPSSQVDEECQEELRKCFEEYGLRGIKVHPAEDGYPSAAVLRTLRAYNKPLLLHCGRGISLTRIEEEIIKPSAMPVILAHMGGFPADRKLYSKALGLAKQYSNVYLNTSFVFYQYVLDLAMTTCPSKVVFGSDAPGIHPLTALSAILPLRVPDKTKEMVLWNNIVRLVEN